MEMERCGATFRNMQAWDYGRPECIELRYEELIANEPEALRRLFAHYGFHDRAIGDCLGIAEHYTFRRVAGREVGETKEAAHLRSGQPGQWREHFRPAHTEAFQRLYGDLVVQLGHEPDNTWTA